MTTSKEKQRGEPDGIKFCVCAMIDLQGFSSHLEISSYDLRTNIGEQAVKRLENLDEIIQLLNSERSSRPEYYPSSFQIQRINDAVFIAMDLDDILKPNKGVTIFQGITGDGISITDEQMESYEKYQTAYDSKIQIALTPLIQFIGFISRIHLSLNKIEGENFFPGAKTVISTGFRRPFKDDYFSANFALSNAYHAEKSLHGSTLYVENGILHMLSFNKYARNLLRLSHFLFKKTSFDCFENNDDMPYTLSDEPSIANPLSMKLFRKEYQFRELNASPLSYLQNVPLLIEYLKETKSADLSNIFFKHIFHAIQLGINRKKDTPLKPPPSFIFNRTNDLKNDIGILQEYITTGKSKIREDLKEIEFNKKHANVTEEGKRKIKELMQQEVEVDIELIDICECKDFLYTLSEEMLNGFLIMSKGDIEQLDYVGEN
jgi:hypothetical protein